MRSPVLLILLLLTFGFSLRSLLLVQSDRFNDSRPGQGTLDWKKIFTAAKTGGIKNYFVEMNLELMKASVPYLRNLKV